MKKVLSFLILSIIFFLPGCSKESKINIEQLVTRFNKEYKYNISTADFILGNDRENEYLFYEDGNRLISVYLDKDNMIKGISLLTTSDETISADSDMFYKLCSVFTGNDITTQKKILDQALKNGENIKFADSNSVFTVGKFKYTVVCNDYSVTFFCDRV